MLYSGLENYGGFLVIGKYGCGEVRLLCDGSVVGLGDVGGVFVVLKVLDRRELMFFGNVVMFSMWGFVICVMVVCFSFGVIVFY